MCDVSLRGEDEPMPEVERAPPAILIRSARTHTPLTAGSSSGTAATVSIPVEKPFLRPRINAITVKKCQIILYLPFEPFPARPASESCVVVKADNSLSQLKGHVP